MNRTKNALESTSPSYIRWTVTIDQDHLNKSKFAVCVKYCLDLPFYLKQLIEYFWLHKIVQSVVLLSSLSKLTSLKFCDNKQSDYVLPINNFCKHKNCPCIFIKSSFSNLISLKITFVKWGVRYFYILIMDEKVLVLCEKWLSKISSNLYVLRPPESEKRVFTKVSVCLSVCL